MPERTHGTPFEAKLLSLMGLSLWLVAGVSSVWEVLALQAPESPFHLGVLSGPITQLRNYSFGLGTVLMVCALWWPTLVPPGRFRLWLSGLACGVLLHTGTLAIAATRGMHAVQVFDPREDARLLLYARAVGHGLTLLAGLALLWQVLRPGVVRRPEAAPDDPS